MDEKDTGKNNTSSWSTVPYMVLLLVCFFTEAAYMCFELAVQRVMSPWFGNSSITWTAIIGIILASGAIGNWLGGKLADSQKRELGFFTVLVASALLVAVIPVFKDSVLPLIAALKMDLRLEASLATASLFFLPSCAMGFLVPMLVASTIEDVKSAGKSTGRMYAVSTLGGIAGTFLGGFVLIPAMSSVQVVYVIAAVFAISAMPFALVCGKKLKIPLLISALMLSAATVAAAAVSGSTTTFGFAGVETFETDTQYSKVIVYDIEDAETDRKVRVMDVGNGYQSKTYVDEDLKYVPVFDYIADYDWAFDNKPNAHNILMIGGAGYSYPKHLISSYSDKRIDVVEIDGEVTEIAKERFFLQDLIDEYSTDETGRLGLITADGREYVNNYDGVKYDIVMNDAFLGLTPPPALCTVEAAQKFKDVMVDDGVYITNIVAADATDEGMAFLRSEVRTLKQVFANVEVIKCKPSEAGGNYMVIASDGVLSVETGSVDLYLSDQDPVLTDDYCPVEAMSLYAELHRAR